MCPAGSTKVGSFSCPQGHYCPELQALDASVPCDRECPTGFTAVIPCPPGTYSDVSGRSSISYCHKCGNRCGDPDGCTYCSGNGSAVDEILCPAGHFCLKGVPSPFACPSGTFRAQPGGSGISPADPGSACATCREGLYCPNGTLVPTSCPPKYYCPTGSGYPILCPNGTFCPPNASRPIVCPPGTFCKDGSEVPTVCEAGTYCAAQSVAPQLCPLGTFGNTNSTLNRTDIPVSCSNCAPGYFGADPGRLVCEYCFAGYVCYGEHVLQGRARIYGSTKGDPTDLVNDGGEICPVGYYCVRGSAKAMPCLPGTYNGNQGSQNASACLKCPPNYFNNASGQGMCRPCGGSSYSSDDSSHCQCKGRNRVFQPSDSACRCMPGFAIFDSNGNPTEDGYSDGVLDCEAKSLARCGAGQIRGQNAQCVQSCDDSKCENPPCYCLNGLDYCNGTCPSFQTSQAQLLQVPCRLCDSCASFLTWPAV